MAPFFYRRIAGFTVNSQSAFFAFLDGEGFVSSTSSWVHLIKIGNWQKNKNWMLQIVSPISFTAIHFGFIILTFSCLLYGETCPRLPRHPRHHQLLRRLPGTLSWPPQIKHLNGHEVLVQMMHCVQFFSSKMEDVTVPSSCFWLLEAGDPTCLFARWWNSKSVMTLRHYVTVFLR